MDFAAGALLGGVNDAGIERTRIYMQAHGALIELARIEDTVDRFERVDGARLRHIHLDGFGGLDGAFAENDVLMHNVEVLDQQTADGDCHPAVLVAVVVDGTGLADLPADGD